MNRAELKSRAKGQIKGSVLILFAMYLVYDLIVAAVSLLPFVPFMGAIIALNNYAEAYAATGEAAALILPLIIPIVIAVIVVTLVAPAFIFGFRRIFLNLAEDKKPTFGDLFAGFRSLKVWGKAIWLFITKEIFIALWALGGFAPGLAFFVFGGGRLDALAGIIFMVIGVILAIAKAISYSQAFYVLVENPHISAKKALAESKDIMGGRTWEVIKLALSFILWILLIIVTAGIAAIWVVPYIQTTFANYYNSIKVGRVEADRKLTPEEKAAKRAQKKKDKKYV